MIRKVGSNPKDIGFCNFCNFVIFGFSFGAFYFTINAFVNFNKLLKAGETLLHVRRSTDLGFELNQEYIPLNFLQATSRSDPSSTSASGLLCRATTWYVDVTFKPCRIPFTQLLFINAFVKRSELARQVYFLFIFMIGEKYRNFREVMEDPRINFGMLFNYKCYIK